MNIYKFEEEAHLREESSMASRKDLNFGMHCKNLNFSPPSPPLPSPW